MRAGIMTIGFDGNADAAGAALLAVVFRASVMTSSICYPCPRAQGRRQAVLKGKKQSTNDAGG